MTQYTGAIKSVSPNVANITSVTLLVAKTNRKYLAVQNNTAANIMVSLNGGTLTGIVPTLTNQGIVLTAGQYYECPMNLVSGTAITVYQSSGGSVNTICGLEDA